MGGGWCEPPLHVESERCLLVPVFVVTTEGERERERERERETDT